MSEEACCAHCGTSRSAADPMTALAWVSDRSEGVARGVRWMCPACARTHARDIEGKLPTEWW